MPEPHELADYLLRRLRRLTTAEVRKVSRYQGQVIKIKVANYRQDMIVDITRTESTWPTAVVKIRSKRSGYVHSLPQILDSRGAVDRFITVIRKPDVSTLIRDTLPRPRTFGRAKFEKQAQISILSQIGTVKILGAVTIEGTGVVSQRNITDPKEVPWLVARCTAHNRAIFYLITDGIRFYPIRFLSHEMAVGKVSIKSKIIADCTTKTVCLEKLGALDRELVVLAIKEWTSQCLK